MGAGVGKMQHAVNRHVCLMQPGACTQRAAKHVPDECGSAMFHNERAATTIPAGVHERCRPAHPSTHAPIHPRTHAPMHPCTHAPMHPSTHAPMHNDMPHATLMQISYQILIMHMKIIN